MRALGKSIECVLLSAVIFGAAALAAGNLPASGERCIPSHSCSTEHSAPARSPDTPTKTEKLLHSLDLSVVNWRWLDRRGAADF